MNRKSNGFKPTCREVHRLVSEAMDRDLSLIERLRVRLHLLVCTACTRFSGQMSLLRQAMRRMPFGATAPPQEPNP